MNAVVLSSVVGGVSVVIGAVMNRLFSSKRSKKSRIDERFGEVFALINALDTKFTSQISGLETKVGDETKNLEIRLTDKFTAQLKEHGERLARIEARLDIAPRRSRVSAWELDQLCAKVGEVQSSSRQGRVPAQRCWC